MYNARKLHVSLFEWREWWIGIAGTFSHNHPMFASSEVWLLQSVAGIQPHPAAEGMHHVLIKPSPPAQLDACNASLMTSRGLISVSWSRQRRRARPDAPSRSSTEACGSRPDEFLLDVSIPPNVVATVHLPASERMHERGGLALCNARRIPHSGEGEGGGCGRGAIAVQVGSGSYAFVTEV